MLEDFFLFSDGFTIVKMHDKKELQIFFVVKMVKKEIGLEISMQIANRLKNYIYFYNVYIYKIIYI